MVFPERLASYILPFDIPCLRFDQVDMSRWDDPLKKTLQTFEDTKLKQAKQIEWRGWTSWVTHREEFTPLIVPNDYKLALYVAVLSWGRSVTPDKQLVNISEDPLSESGGTALFISGPKHQSLVALADFNNLFNQGLILIAGLPSNPLVRIAGMVVLNAVQEAEDRIRYVNQSLTLP